MEMVYQKNHGKAKKIPGVGQTYWLRRVVGNSNGGAAEEVIVRDLSRAPAGHPGRAMVKTTIP